MRVRRLIAAASTTILSIAAVVLVTGSPAAAAGTQPFCTQPGAHAGYGCFWPQGDIIGVNDMFKDGLRTVVEWRTDDRTGECHDANGGQNGWTYCNYDFKEGRDKIIVFRTVARDGAHGADKYPTVPVVGWISGRA